MPLFPSSERHHFFLERKALKQWNVFQKTTALLVKLDNLRASVPLSGIFFKSYHSLNAFNTISCIQN